MNETKKDYTPTEKKPTNKKLYVGIGLLLIGVVAIIYLLIIQPLLAIIGCIMVSVGLGLITIGTNERKIQRILLIMILIFLLKIQVLI